VRRLQNSPLSAALSLSVPPPVKISSDGRQSTAAASDSRDSSTIRRARRPLACSEEGLPAPASAAVKAATASGRIGVVAAWSR
jgi:hypothetical protein